MDAIARIEMRPVASLKPHPAQEHIPKMQPAEWGAFLADVAAVGITEPLTITPTGIILDGRQRRDAAEIQEIENVPCRVVDLSDDEQEAHVYRTAAMRRNLKESQRAILAARMKPYYAALAKKRQQAAGESHGRGKVSDNCPEPIQSAKASDEAGAVFNVSGKSVERAEAVLEQGSAKVIAAVEQGTLAVSTAAKLCELPKREQNAAIDGGRDAIKEAIGSASTGTTSTAEWDFDVECEKLSAAVRKLIEAFPPNLRKMALPNIELVIGEYKYA